jgi:hypothetical protein
LCRDISRDISGDEVGGGRDIRERKEKRVENTRRKIYKINPKVQIEKTWLFPIL